MELFLHCIQYVSVAQWTYETTDMRSDDDEILYLTTSINLLHSITMTGFLRSCSWCIFMVVFGCMYSFIFSPNMNECNRVGLFIFKQSHSLFTTESNVNRGAICGFQMNFRMVVIAETVQEVRCLHRDDVHQDSSEIHSTNSRMETAQLVVSISPASPVTCLLVMVRHDMHIILHCIHICVKQGINHIHWPEIRCMFRSYVLKMGQYLSLAIEKKLEQNLGQYRGSLIYNIVWHDAWKLQYLLGGTSLSTFPWQHGIDRYWTTYVGEHALLW